MEKRILIETLAALPRQPAAAWREEEQRGLQSWGLPDKRRSLEVFLWGPGGRRGWGQAGHEGLTLPRAGLSPPSPDQQEGSSWAGLQGSLCPAEVSGQDLTPLGTSSFTLPS